MCSRALQAAFLGYKNVVDIRKLIARNVTLLKGAGHLETRVLKLVGPGRPRKEYWLNKQQAYLIAARSETAVAQGLLLEGVQGVPAPLFSTLH